MVGGPEKKIRNAWRQFDPRVVVVLTHRVGVCAQEQHIMTSVTDTSYIILMRSQPCDYSIEEAPPSGEVKYKWALGGHFLIE